MKVSRSITLRLTLALGTISLLVFAVTAVLLHHSLANELARASHVELLGKIDLVKRFVDAAGADQGLASLREHLDYALVEQPDLRVWIEGPDGLLLYGDGPPRVVDRLDELGHLTLVRADGVAMEAMEERVKPQPALPVSRILVAFETRGRDQLLSGYRNALIALSAAAVLLSAGLGAAAAWRSLEPVKRLSDEAAAIGARSIDVRLSDRQVADELAGLVRAFNAVLDRLEAAYRQVEGFSADVAHELRTPLATLISGTQVVLSRPRAEAELRETLASNLEDLERLKVMVNDMLFLDRADRGEMAQTASLVELAEEADKALDYCDALLQEAGLRAVRRGSATVRCNAALVRRALANLLSNAIKHTARGNTLSLEVQPLPGGARLSVFNPGAPIPPEVASRMFDRFYRADEARRDSHESHGLGLAIVRAVARMHGGTAFVQRAEGGTRVGFDLVGALPGPSADTGRIDPH